MNDICKTTEVTLQENGIVRDSDGLLLGRLNKSIERDEIIAAVAQGWCSPENEGKEFDSILAEAIKTNIVNLHAHEVTTAQIGMEALTKAMVDDIPSEQGSYAHSWHCNIAMMCVDAITSECPPTAMPYDVAHKIGNDAASRFMKLCFDVETKA